jgi:hypothetical protein
MNRLYLFFLLASTFLLWSCTSRPSTTVEQPVAQLSSDNSGSSTSPPAAKSHPASAAEVETTLKRVFGGAVAGDRRERWFVTGDFNGDGSSDLAMLVRPVRARLKAINDPLANWTVQDAAHAFFPPPNQRVVLLPPKPSRPSIRVGEMLVAVVHGYGEDGWRDPQARQAYLLRNAGASAMRAIPAPDHVLGAPVSIRRSQIIYEESGQPGFLFWTGSQYAWRALLNGNAIFIKAAARDPETPARSRREVLIGRN